MFNNRQSRRRFRLGNLAKLVHLRQSVRRQPTQPQQPPSPPHALQETMSQSPPRSPSFQPQLPLPQSPFVTPPNQFSSPILSPSTFSPSPDVPPEPKSTSRSPSFQIQSPKALQPQQSPEQLQLPIYSPKTLPPFTSESGENHPSPPHTPPLTSLEPKSTPRLPSFQLQPPEHSQSLQPLKPPQSPVSALTTLTPPFSESDQSHRSPPRVSLEPKSSQRLPAFQPQPTELLQSPQPLKPPQSSVSASPTPSKPFSVSSENRRSPSHVSLEPKTTSASPSFQLQPPDPLRSLQPQQPLKSPQSPESSLSTLLQPISKSGVNRQSPPRASFEPKSTLDSPAFHIQQPELLQSLQPQQPLNSPQPSAPSPKKLSPPVSKSDENRRSPPLISLEPKQTPNSPPFQLQPLERVQPLQPPQSSVPSPTTRTPWSLPRESSTLKSLPPSPTLQPQPLLPPPNHFSSPVTLPSTLTPSFSKSGDDRESQLHMSPKSKSSTPLPSSPKSRDESESHLASQQRSKSPLLPPKYDESQPPSLTSMPSQPLTPTIKTPPSPSSKSKITLEPQSQTSPPLSSSKAIRETLFLSPPPPQASQTSLIKPKESQSPIQTPQTKTSPVPPLTLNDTSRSQSQLDALSKSHDEALFRSPPRHQPSTLSPSKSSVSQLPLQPPSLPLYAKEDSQSQPLPQLVSSKSTNEIMFRSQPQPQLSKSGESQAPNLPPLTAEAETSMSSLSTVNTKTYSQLSLPLPSSRSIDKKLLQSPPLQPVLQSPPTKSIEELKSKEPSQPKHSSPPPLLLPKPTDDLHPQFPIRSIPPSPSQHPNSFSMEAPFSSLSTPLKTQINMSPKPSMQHQIGPKPIKPTSPKHTNTKANNSEGTTGLSSKNSPEKQKSEAMIMMFVNSNVQGINTSLSVHSSSIDHEPGVHLTIDYDQSCYLSTTPTPL